MSFIGTYLALWVISILLIPVAIILNKMESACRNKLMWEHKQFAQYEEGMLCIACLVSPLVFSMAYLSALLVSPALMLLNLCGWIMGDLKKSYWLLLQIPLTIVLCFVMVLTMPCLSLGICLCKLVNIFFLVPLSRLDDQKEHAKTLSKLCEFFVRPAEYFRFN